MSNAFREQVQIDFTHNLAKTVDDIQTQLNRLSRAQVNVPVRIGGRGGSGGSSSVDRELQDLARKMNSIDFSKGLVKTEVKAQRFRKSINELGTEMEKIGFQAANTAKKFGAFLAVSTIFVGLTSSIRDGVSAAIEYEKQMAKIAQVTGNSIKNLGSLDKEITRLSTSLGVGSDSIVEVALTLAQAGLSARDTAKALEVLSKTQLSATFDNIKNTTEGAIAIMAQFKTSAADLEGQLSSINTVAARFAVESSDLVEVIRKSGGAFRATGGELNELLALFTSVRATTRESAESISTGLRTIFTRLQRNRTVNFLSELGIDLRNAKGEFIGIYPAIEKLSKSLENISGTDPRFNQIVEELGGFRQVSKVIPLLKQFETSQKALSVARRAGNSIDRDAIIAQETLGNQMSRVKEEFLALTRAYMNNSALKSGINLLLQTASALIKVGDAIRPLIPLMGLLAGANVVPAIGNLLSGAKASFATPARTFGYTPKKMAVGGVVPGSGSGDTFPAMLEPGEFVVRKSAVKALGKDKLHSINKYANGGVVNRGSIFSLLKEFQKKTGLDPSGLTNKIRIKNGGRGVRRGEFTANADDTSNREISIFKDAIDSRSQLKKTLFHELGHSVDLGKKKLKSTIPDTLHSSIANNFFDLEAERLKTLKVTRGISHSTIDKRLGSAELFANAFAHSYTNPKSRFAQKNKSILQMISEDTSSGIKRGMFIGKPPVGIENLLEGGLLNLGQNPNRAAVRRYAGGGLVKYLMESRARSKAQGLGQLFGKYKKESWRGSPDGSEELIASLKRGFSNPLGTAKGVASGIGGFVGSLGKDTGSRIKGLGLAFQDSLGISRRNPIWGDPRYTSVQGYNDKINNMSRASLNPKGNPLLRLNRVVKPIVKPKSIVTMNNVRALFAELERDLGGKFDRNIIKSIKISDRIPNEIVGFAAGTYNPREKQISLARKDIKTKEALRETLYHELGHGIDRAAGDYKGYNSQMYPDSGLRKFADIALDREKYNSDGTRNLSYEKYFNSTIEKFARNFSDIFENKRYKKILLPELIARNLFKKNKTPKKFATGGWVSGSGETDTVPSLLTPGEFVVNKKSAKAFGYHNLNKINKYANGGAVLNTAGFGLSLAPQIASQFLPKQTEQQIKQGDATFDSLLGGVTAAGASLLLFSIGVKRDTDKFTDAMLVAEKKIESANNDFIKNQTKIKKELGRSDDYNDKKIKAKTDDSKTLLKDYKETRARRLAEIQANNSYVTFGNKTYQLPPATKEKQENVARIKEAMRVDKEANKDRLAKNRASIDTFTNAKAVKTAEANAKLAELEKARKNTVDPLELERKKQDAELKTVERLNSFNEKLAIGSAIVIGFGAALSDSVQRKANAGKKTGITGLSTVFEGTVAGAATYGAGGAIGGSAFGGTIGSFFGQPVLGAQIGAGVGAIGGGIVGGVSGYNSTNDAINRFDINKSFEKLSVNLDNLKSGRATASGSRSKINDAINEIDKGFFTFTGSDFEAFKGNVDSSIDGLTLFFDESLKAAKSSGEFRKENEKLISVLTRFGGFTIQELEKKIEDEIKARNKSLKIVEDYNAVVLENARRLESTFLIERAINSVEGSLVAFGDRLDKTAQILTGSFQASKTSFDFSSLSNIAGANSADLQRQSQQAAGFVGGPAAGLATDIVKAGELSAKLPSILNDLVFTNQLQGDELLDGLKKQIGGGFAGGLVLEAVKKEVGSTGDTTNFLEKFRLNPIEITKTIQESLQGTAKALADAMPRITNQFNEFADGLALARQAFFNTIEGRTESINIAQVGSELDFKVRGKTLPFADAKAFDTQRGNLLTNGNNAQQLGERLRSSQNNILRLNTERQGASKPDDVKNLTKAIEDNVKEVELTTKGLKYLADVNSRLATAEQERARLEQIRESKTNLAKSYVTGSPQEKNAIAMSIRSANMMRERLARGEDPLAGMSQQMKEGGFNILEQFSADGGKEVIDKILKSQGFNLDPNAKEQEVINEEKSIIKEAMAAQDVLNTNLQANNDKFLTGLETKFDTFFTNLEGFFKSEGEKQRTAVNNEIEAKVAGIEKQIKAIEKAKGLVGLNPGAPLSQLTGNLDIGEEIFNNEDKLVKFKAEIDGLKANRENIKDVVDTRMIEELLPVGDERNALMKKARNIKKNGSSNLSHQNRQLDDLLRPAFEKAQQNLVDRNEELTERLGVENKRKFINSASAAKEVIKKAEIGDEDVDKKRKRIEDLKATRRANGGNVYGARGSDTVPAMTTDGRPYMLTPGEYVMKRTAVQKYGTQMLSMMNKGYLASGGSVRSASAFDRGEGALLSISLRNAQNLKDKEEISRKLAEATAASEQQKKDSYDKKINRVIEDTEWQVRDRPLQEYRENKARKEAIVKNPPSNSDAIGKIFFKDRDKAREKQNWATSYYQREYSDKAAELRKQGVPGNMIRQTLGQQNRERILQERQQSKGGQSFQNVQDKGATTAQKPQQINPQLMEDFNKVADKLIGAKIAFEITGTVNVNINSSNIGDDITQKFTPVIQEYVNNEIGKAISKFAAANGIPHVNVPVNKGQK